MSKDIRPQRSDFILLGETLCEKIRERTKKGKGVESDFKAYTSKYRARKVAGKFPRQSSKSSKPDLQLSGDMLRDLQVRGANRDSVQIGWTGSFAQRVIHNAEAGREITRSGKALAKELETYTHKEVKRLFNKQLNKNFNKTTHIKIK